MRFALMIEAQQGLSYEDQLAIVRRAEAGGFEAWFRSDHYASVFGREGVDSTDAWATLSPPLMKMILLSVDQCRSWRHSRNGTDG